MGIDRLHSEYDIGFHWTAFPLNPTVPPEGYPLADYYASRNLDLAERVGHMRQVAEQLGLPFGRRERIYNSRLAQEVGKWAEQKGLGNEFHHAVFKAYFVENVNIAQPEVLEAIGAEVGLDGAELREVIESRSHRSEVDEDWQRSRALGITAVPTLVMKGMPLVGMQPYENLSRFVEFHGMPRRKGR